MPKRKPKPHPWCERLRWFPCPHFTLCLNKAQFGRVVEMLKVKANHRPDFVLRGSNATTHFFTCKDESEATAVVTLDSTKGRQLEQVVSLLAHEGVHIWQECLKSAGEKSPSSEFEAYALQHIVKELVRLYRKLKR